MSTTERLRAVEAAKYLIISRSTLAKWRMRGYGPPFSRVGERVVVYLKADIDAWLAERAAEVAAVFQERQERSAAAAKQL